MNEEQIQKVIMTMQTAGWREVMQPAYANRARLALNALALSETERPNMGGDFAKLSDADLRAIIRECEWWLTVWKNHIGAYYNNRKLDELETAGSNGAMANP